jgi:uncharacterized protein (DUF433 family)
MRLAGTSGDMIARRHERISIDPGVMVGKPCIKGTGIPVDLRLRYLGDGQSIEDVLAAFPGLTPEDLRAAVGYAAQSHRTGG